MKNRAVLGVMAVLFLSSACVNGRQIVATTYGPMSLFGGYKEKEIEQGVWRVTGTGNMQAEAGFGGYVAFYRAAELIKSKGFGYMQILDHNAKGLTAVGVGGSFVSTHAAGDIVKLTVRGISDPAAPLSCRSEDPASCRTLAVDEVMAKLAPYLTFRKGHPAAR